MWQALKTFFQNLGHTILSDIMTALPEVKQLILQGITILVDAAIAYVEAKYGVQAQGIKAMSPEAKLEFDTQRHNDAFNYVKAEIAKSPSAYPKGLTDSLIHFQIELSVQKAKTIAEGNKGNFPGGDSGPQ